jgi:hypothetical protein
VQLAQLKDEQYVEAKQMDYEAKPCVTFKLVLFWIPLNSLLLHSDHEMIMGMKLWIIPVENLAIRYSIRKCGEQAVVDYEVGKNWNMKHKRSCKSCMLFCVITNPILLLPVAGLFRPMVLAMPE